MLSAHTALVILCIGVVAAYPLLAIWAADCGLDGVGDEQLRQGWAYLIGLIFTGAVLFAVTFVLFEHSIVGGIFLGIALSFSVICLTAALRKLPSNLLAISLYLLLYAALLVGGWQYLLAE